MARFMADIENGKDFLQLSSCDMVPHIDTKKPGKESAKIPISFQMDVASIKVEQ